MTRHYLSEHNKMENEQVEQVEQVEPVERETIKWRRRENSQVS